MAIGNGVAKYQWQYLANQWQHQHGGMAKA
jgi:hypothetical protein